MKKLSLRTSLLAVGATLFFFAITAFIPKNTTPTSNFVTSAVQFESIGQLSFSPEGVLFFGDSKGGALFALETSDTDAENNEALNINDIEEKIGQMLGATSRDISVIDMAIHPMSQKAYLSVMRGNGAEASYHIVTAAKDQTLAEVDLSNASHSKYELTTAPARDAKDRRGRSLRTNTITDIAYADGSVYVAGLSNEEFASGFRKVAFPFDKEESLTTLEVYHIAHGQFETHSPIRSFAPYSLNGEQMILAGYTCTPLVLFSINDLEDGKHVNGKTIAELGFGNTPLDILPFTDSSGKQAVMIANSNRAAMLISGEEIAGQEAITTPLEGNQILKGTQYKPLPLNGLQQIDSLNEDHFVFLRRLGNGSLRLYSLSKSRIVI
ncbi:MAG: hypothetical protein RLN81_00450 [Balneolaceae bacterium]